MKGYVFGPITTQGVIKRSIVNAGDTTNNQSLESVTVEPALTTSGTSTSNNALSVPINEIDADDNYGFATNIGDTNV